jgi:hypothetical protein
MVAYENRSPSGIMVVHDCLPRNASMSTHYVPGNWSGVTAIAFRDFVTKLTVDWFVIDSNFGIGVVSPETGGKRHIDSELESKWNAANLNQKLHIFKESSLELMRAISLTLYQGRVSNGFRTNIEVELMELGLCK